MTTILTAAEMRDVERRAIESGHVTGLDLMERAGQGVVAAVKARWPRLAGGRHQATILCGPGNNGGDGFVMARLLALLGWGVRVLFSGDPLRLSPDAREMHDRWGVMGRIDELNETILRGGPTSDLYVDAVFGLGLARGPEGEVADALSHMGGRNGDLSYYQPRTVAVDAPSGLDLDSGRVLGTSGRNPGNALRAALTVTFQTLKPGHLLAHGPGLCGRVVVADLGLDPWMRMEAPRFRDGSWVGIGRRASLALVEAPQSIDRNAATAWPWARLDKNAWEGGHKYDHGHAVVLGGGPGRGGAARMTARGALRIGAGLVTLAVPPAAVQENAARLDAVMLRSVKNPEALAEYLSDPRLNALCIGPGFGTSEQHSAMLAALLDASRGDGSVGQDVNKLAAGEVHELSDAASRLEDVSATPGADQPASNTEAPQRPKRHPSSKSRPTVLDADALTLLARNPALRAKLHSACVLTPHEGEFARLFPAIDAKWRAPAATGPAYSKVDAARDAANEADCIVLLKGPDTVIADPTGRAAINAAVYDRAAPWLATAGSGDVLAGFITGLLARGLDPFDAACTAAWLHVECARSFGPGLIAEDLPEELPKVFRALGL